MSTETWTRNPDSEISTWWYTDWWRTNNNWQSQKYVELTGSTVEEKTREMLEEYGLHNYGQRKKLSQKAWIKTEFAVCLSRAETSLGKKKKSVHNRFNCGNTDGWKTISAETFEHWFNIFDKSCINGKYIWRKKTLWDLAPRHPGWWCTTDCKYVYASSTDNRMTNMTNCLGMIYDKKIEPSFNFRLQQWE